MCTDLEVREEHLEKAKQSMEQCCRLAFFDEHIIEYSGSIRDERQQVLTELQLHVSQRVGALDEAQLRQTFIKQELHQQS